MWDDPVIFPGAVNVVRDLGTRQASGDMLNVREVEG